MLALGGASWPRLGSDGDRAEMLAARGVQISPLRPTNSGFIGLVRYFRDRFEGQPLKGVALTFGAHSVRGKAIVTELASKAAWSMRCRPSCARRSRAGQPCTWRCGPIST